MCDGETGCAPRKHEDSQAFMKLSRHLASSQFFGRLFLGRKNPFIFL
jgi:hypothetical protein